MHAKKHKNLNQPALSHKLKIIGSWLDEHKAENILLLDVQNSLTVFEGLVIASANNVRHAQALADHILDKVAEYGYEYLGMEGYQHGEWILIDLNDIVVHIFLPETREFYNLEGFWFKAQKIY
ncbi:MAG: ribosome silencing factor [Desulfonauticus sp.]|nr:ribosome silencing factor [Desulfonauticus sp.]